MGKEVLLDDLFLAEMIDRIDINQAFHEAAHGVMTDKEMALNEKVARIEHIIQEADSDFYREFVDLRSMAAQIEMMCEHDHSLQAALHKSEAATSFIDQHTENSRQDHNDRKRHNKLYKQRKEKDKKKQNKKLKKLTGWALLGIIQKSSC